MTEEKKKKPGIVYLATIPETMNVSKIREIFSEFGRLGRVYLELDRKGKKKNNIFTEFKEGWIEFERKTVAKFVAAHLNNRQVSGRKGSRHFDTLWNIRYLSGFKWHHLHERLIYEKATRQQKRREKHADVKLKLDWFKKKDKKLKKPKKKQLKEGGNV